MKPIVIFLVVVLALAAESAFRGKNHKSKAKAVKDEEVSEPGDDEDDNVEWPHPVEIKPFTTESEFSTHGGFEFEDRIKSKHGKASRKSHSH